MMIKRWGDVLGGAGTVVVSILSCALCPMCLPVYAGFLSIIGIELAEFHAFFFPLMMTFGFVTLGFMAHQIHTHHGNWTPFKFAVVAALGMGAAALYDIDYLLYACVALFMGSVIWNKRSLVHEGHGCC